MKFSPQSLALVLAATLIGVIETNAMPVPDESSAAPSPTSLPPPPSTSVSPQCLVALDGINKSPLGACNVGFNHPDLQGPAVVINETELDHFCTSPDCGLTSFSDALTTIKTQCASDLQGNTIASAASQLFAQVPYLVKIGCVKGSTGAYCPVELENTIQKYYADNNLVDNAGPGNFQAEIGPLSTDLVCTTCSRGFITDLASVTQEFSPHLYNLKTALAAKCQ